jgi:hypothetical protein
MRQSLSLHMRPRAARSVLVVLCALGGAAGAADLSTISNTDASAGLKKALQQGIDRAVGELGVTDGFLKNPRVKIDLPPKLAKAEGLLRTLGAGGQLDRLITSMNRAAESAVPESKMLFIEALHHISIVDAKQILSGGEDSATQYFRRVTGAALKAKFAPIIASAVQKVKLSEQYDAVAQKGVALGILKPEDASVESYVSEKTLDGLFLIMADEERAIRHDPLGQANSLLKRVFEAAH